ncbi:MAG: 50S ribosomal protein L25 [Caldilineaceae bacterium]
MADLKLAAQPRTLVGRKVRQLRNQGLLPVVVYGKKQQEAESLQVETRSFERILHSAGFSQLVTIDVDGGKTHNVLIRDVQRHPVTHHPMHVDFYAVDMSEKQQVSVPVHAMGKAGALDTGLMVFQALDNVVVEALPAGIPTHVEVDISGLTLENSITVADLPALDGVTYVNEPDETVFSMITTRGAIEEEEAEEIEDMEASAEPELVTRGRDEDEEEA